METTTATAHVIIKREYYCPKTGYIWAGEETHCRQCSAKLKPDASAPAPRFDPAVLPSMTLDELKTYRETGKLPAPAPRIEVEATATQYLRASLRAALDNSTHAQSCPAWNYIAQFRDSSEALDYCDCWRKSALALI